MLQGPSVVQVGRVRAVFWGRDATVAATLADEADRERTFPGITDLPNYPIRLVIVRSEARYDSITRDRLPAWSGAAAFPGMHTIVLKLNSGDPHQVLRHELAHLALHQVASVVPRWFDEGYAAYAAREWGRLDALSVSWALVRGDPPTLEQLNHDLRAGPARAEAAYAFATTAVLYLARLGGDRGLGPLLTNLHETRNFDAALRMTHLMTAAQFQEAWLKDLRTHYGWLRFLTSFAVFWGVIGAALIAVWIGRRRRDRARRAALDQGWSVPDVLADDERPA
ncbi:MAG TPA: hypothetical protein VJ992_06450 [Gemmatimonadales bacterium]|nr:hypothetical protein [Gemmatimonadales bacterium]